MIIIRISSYPPIDPGKYVTSIKSNDNGNSLDKIFSVRGWDLESFYPESDYRCDYAFNKDGRYIFIEVELSDIRRLIEMFYMERVFRTGYMRLGIAIYPESKQP